MFTNISRRFFPACFGLLACLLLTGCGSGNIKVGGSVKFSDGTPLNCGTVLFETPANQYVGHIKSDGTYTVSGLKENDGLPAGSYKVAVTGANEYVRDEEGNEVEKSLIDSKYTSTSTSELTFEVTPTNKVFNIVLEKATP